MYDGAILFKALKVRGEQFCIAATVEQEANVAHITLASYDHVVNTALLCGQQSLHMLKFGNLAIR